MSDIKYKLYLPKDFLKKEVNEKAVEILLKRALSAASSRRGDPLKREPDLILDGKGVEITFAADGKYETPFVGQYCDGVYTADEAENSLTVPILSALERKSRKQYADRPVAVAVLCMLELFDWCGDTFDRELMGLPKRERDAFFSLVRSLYIERGVFSNVYLLAPTLTRKWIVFDLKNDGRYLVLSEDGDDDFLPLFEKL